MPKNDFNTDFALEGGPLRTVGEIREYSADYQLALAEHTGKTKLSSANWFNSEHAPLDNDLADDCTILR